MMWYWGYACAISGEKLNVTMDHWIPLNSDNCPGTIPTNIIPLNGSLNSQKQDKDPETGLIEKFGNEQAKHILQKIQAYFDWVCEITSNS